MSFSGLGDHLLPGGEGCGHSSAAHDVWVGQKSATVKEAIGRIAVFYEIETKARFVAAAERLVHWVEAAPLLAAFFDWANTTVTKLSATGGAGSGVPLHHQTAQGTVSLSHRPRLEIDNNIAENAIRGAALGRKNYLFAGADSEGERAAAMYTIMQTAKLDGINPEAYLRDTLARIAEGHPISRINELMPWPKA